MTFRQERQGCQRQGVVMGSQALGGGRVQTRVLITPVLRSKLLPQAETRFPHLGSLPPGSRPPHCCMNLQFTQPSAHHTGCASSILFVCVNGKVAQIQLLFQGYSDPTGVIWSLPLCSCGSLEAGFVCDCIMCSKDFEFPSPALKNQEPLQTESNLRALLRTWKRQRQRARALLHNGAWLDRSCGLPLTERVPSCVPRSPLAGHTAAHQLSLLGTSVPTTPGAARRGQEPDGAGGHRNGHPGNSALTKGGVASIPS